MIQKIIFSKNRACQLELLLRSMNKHWNLDNITILYTCDNEFKPGYDKVISMYSNVTWIKETKFKMDLQCLITHDKYITLLVDDDVVISNIDEENVISHLEEDVSCVSLRLGKNLNYCYTMNQLQTIPNIVSGKFLWKGASCDWNYTMSLDGHVFRTNDIIPLLDRLDYYNPNSLEGILSLNPINRPYMFCYETSKLFNIPCNKVQVGDNRHGNVSPSILNLHFLEGGIIELESIDKILPTACHEEREFIWIH